MGLALLSMMQWILTALQGALPICLTQMEDADTATATPWITTINTTTITITHRIQATFMRSTTPKVKQFGWDQNQVKTQTFSFTSPLTIFNGLAVYSAQVLTCHRAPTVPYNIETTGRQPYIHQNTLLDKKQPKNSVCFRRRLQALRLMRTLMRRKTLSATFQTSIAKLLSTNWRGNRLFLRETLRWNQTKSRT